MTIGLTGVHRTGKTTLARAYAEKHGIPFVETSASKIMLEAGFDPKAHYPMDDRLYIQGLILEGLERAYSNAGRMFITDRTPIDAAAYMLADVTREPLPSWFEGALMGYLKKCIDVTNRYFSLLVVVQPGIEIKDEPGKAPATPAYMEHISKLIMGLAVDERVSAYHYYIPARITDLQKRIRSIEVAWERSLAHSAEALLGEVVH